MQGGYVPAVAPSARASELAPMTARISTPEALSLSGIPATGCVRCCQPFGIFLLLFGATSQLYVMLADQTAGIILLY